MYLALTALALASPAIAAEKDTRVYEMRVYTAAPGKLDALHARFRDHTIKLFEKHGITNLGYFVPVDNKDNKLVYFVSYPSMDARAKSFKAFGADPDWKKAHAESEKDGPLLIKDGGIKSTFMAVTDYSPVLKVAKGTEDRVFELRTYITTPKNLPNLDDRFKDHTIKLFEKHGMTNLIYWHLQPDQKGAENTLIYLLAHKSVDAAKASFGTFRNDPDWNAARTASEKKGGGSLTEAKGGVVSLFLKATEYSPLK
ncbi:MAG TPA: NIPSNAP family protein [Gemmataceae bacterium]|nr:NIPSNAP family protein [Gemmataceae bacterium]